MSTRTAKEFAALEVMTAANLNKAAGGWIGYAANSSDQSGITTTTDVSNATVTVTCGTARLLLIIATATVTVSGTVNDWLGTILQDGNIIGRWARVTGMSNGNVEQCTGFAIATPSAGTHIYKMQAGVTNGGGSIEVSGTSPAQAKLLVIDLGASA
jgi:hypothetical protein